MATSGTTQHLHIKSFFAPSVKEALALGHRELGPDALLLQAREAPPEARHLGACEVVLGVSRQPAAASVASAALSRGPENAAIEDALVQLKAFMRTLPAPARDSGVANALIEAGILHEMAHDIDRAARQRSLRGSVIPMTRPGPATRSPSGQIAATVAELASRFTVTPGLQRITALVGPPGAGKTTTLVKLAVSEGLRAGRRVRLISVDTQRIGAAEQLRTYATILGVPFQVAESPAALDQAIQAALQDELILIDTPGFSGSLQMELGPELAQYLSSRQDIDTHLVLTASSQHSVLQRLVESHAIYRPARLLFTRIDEVESLASVFCAAARHPLPLSYFGCGQLIPEDLQPAGSDRVTDSLVRRLPAYLQAVA